MIQGAMNAYKMFSGGKGGGGGGGGGGMLDNIGKKNSNRLKKNLFLLRFNISECSTNVCIIQTIR
jgi:hypothetical protein